jgi:enediyne biosynthesis protein E4
MKHCFGLLLLVVLVSSCGKNTPSDALFESLSPNQTGLDFENRVEYTKEFNIFNYRNFYNGGGVAIGDVNGDGLSDVYVSANFGENKLFLNKGNWQFDEVTTKAGVQGTHAWSTGVTFADVNGDGRLDIYVCNSGNLTNQTQASAEDRTNELFINQGNDAQGIPHFVEKAKDYGLDDKGFGTHAAFFDFDRDGDLDMYLLNNSFTDIGRLNYQNFRGFRDKLGGDKLFRNDGQTFTDVSEQAGIYGSLIGFGLGITIGDVNRDNWLDIYISNDFYERDYLYINQKDGTFKESLEDQMPHISLSSMGADVADLNNDGLLDIFVTDMLPGDDYRLKTTSVFEGYELTQFKLKQGYWNQVMRNNLHLNNGNGTFSEVACLAGMQATDWSWGALLFDMDNDGLKDVFVANGIAKDLTDQDFVNFLGDRSTVQQALETRTVDIKGMIDKISSKPIPNYAFRNKGQLQFENKAFDWGLGEPGFSNGAAYGDLDNDGDLDLIVNNVNAPLGVFKNRSNEQNKTHFLRLKLNGTPQNRNGIGATVSLYQAGNQQVLQQMPNRGFQSSSDHVMVFGLGQTPQIDSLVVVWPDDQKQVIGKPKADQTLTLSYQNATQKAVFGTKPATELLTDISPNIGYKHSENEGFVDYNRDGLLKRLYSTDGPALAVGDVNGDGLDDVYLGGASGQTKHLFVQTAAGKWQEKPQPAFGSDMTTENVDAVFFDADGDRDLDLYVVTGSNEFAPGSDELHDVYYTNDGRGNFSRDIRIPAINESGSCVAVGDADADGDLDLFVGTRLIPGNYGLQPTHYLLINDGKGAFRTAPKNQMPTTLGMVTDAEWLDIDGDRRMDLAVASDWGPVHILHNEKGILALNPTYQVANAAGWWNTLKAIDIDLDGDLDLVAGNLGLNSRLKASPEKPAELWVNDLDKNGSIEQIINTVTENGEVYPMVQKSDLQKVVPAIKQKFLKYTDYAEKKMDELFGQIQLQGSTVWQAQYAATALWINDGKGHFSLSALPIEAQFAPICGIESSDFNNDGLPDLLLTGNFTDQLPELGPADANHGLVLLNKGKGKFETLPNRQIGLMVKGQVRRSAQVRSLGKDTFILAKNNAAVQVLRRK